MVDEAASTAQPIEGTRQRLARSVLEHADKAFELFLLGEANVLFGCQLVASDNDALVVKNDRGTYLVPWGSVQCVKLNDDPEHLESISMLSGRA
jgi:hypothetical protein